MRFLLPMLLACSSDIAIITPTEKVTDTEEETVTTQDTQTEQPSSEPDSQMTEMSVGLATLHFRQISCPECVGATGEFDIRAELLLHYHIW